MKPFLFYDFNKGTRVDLIVISGDKLYAIKLFSTLKKRSKIILRKPNLFTLEKFYIRAGSSFNSMVINYLPDEIVKQLSVNIFDYPEISYVESSQLFLPAGLGVAHENIYNYKRSGEFVFGNKIIVSLKGIIEELSGNGKCHLDKSQIKRLKKQLKSKYI